MKFNLFEKKLCELKRNTIKIFSASYSIIFTSLAQQCEKVLILYIFGPLTKNK